MPQSRRRRWRTTTLDSHLGSSTHTTAPPAPSSVNSDNDEDDFMPHEQRAPTHNARHRVHEPSTIIDRKGKSRASSSHTTPPPAPVSVTWDDDEDDFMPRKPWPPTGDAPHPVHQPRTRKERKGKSGGSSSHTTPPAAPSSVNWDDDEDDFMPRKPW